MNDIQKADAQEIVDLCGSYQNAVNAVLHLERALWFLSLQAEPAKIRHKGKTANHRVFDETLLSEKFASSTPDISSEVAARFIATFKASSFCWTGPDGKKHFSLSVFQPLSLVRALLAGLKPEYELRYYVMQSIKKHYACRLSYRTARIFHLLANAVNSLIEGNSTSFNTSQDLQHSFNYEDSFLPALIDIMQKITTERDEAQRAVELFLECCRETGFVGAHYKGGHIVLRTTAIDAEYLISNLFGIPTAIRGFDELFGGGGLILAEAPGPHDRPDPEQLPGRTILIMGRFGTGKSLLSLQLAVEVARKGGLAWIMPLEQTREECLYMLESMSTLPLDESVIIATDIASAAKVLRKEKEDQGAIILLNTIKDSYDDFLATFTENAKQMHKYPLRLIGVDPVNSIHRGGENISITLLRDKTMQMISKVKQSGTNVMLIAEEGSEKGSDSRNELLFEQNIADTVIHLSIKSRHEYAQRYFEITKSRLQREQRGIHPFSIRQDVGINISPSSAAVSARISQRRQRPPEQPVQYGLPALDLILGKEAMTAGDAVVFKGSGGSFKTPLGLLFLLNSDIAQSDKRGTQLRSQSLLIAARDSEATVRHILEQKFIRQHIKENQTNKNINDVRIRSIQRSNVKPGHIIQLIEDELVDARKNGRWIDRVMIDNVAHLELSCPFIRDDEIFGDTLVNYLRRYQVTSLLVCGDVSHDSHSFVQRSIIDNADCLIKFNQFEFRGTSRVMIRVLKSRGMKHRRELFQLNISDKKVDIEKISPLLRVGHSGRVAPIKIRMFLRSDTNLQYEYNKKFLDMVRGFLSQNIDLTPQNYKKVSKAMRFANFSSVDELQVVQLDEFQIPEISSQQEKDRMLHVFPTSNWDGREWGDSFINSFVERVRYKGSFCAVPYYSNVGLLAYRNSELNGEHLNSWANLADKCDEWERRNTDPGSIFFDFSRGTGEDYNCLFFEILLSLAEPGFHADFNLKQRCQLQEWLISPTAIKAGKIFRRLCRRAYLTRSKNTSVEIQGRTTEPQPKQGPLVWRHWYVTLNQLMSDMEPQERRGIQVSSLPGDIAIAGEWYLALPSHSAAPSVGLEIIKSLTSHDAEIERLISGVGLPTRTSFYNADRGALAGEIPISPFFSMDPKTVLDLNINAFRRSRFGCYAQFADIITHNLQRIIEIPDMSDVEIEGAIKTVFKSLKVRMEFIGSNQNCRTCKINLSLP
jgi:KaiC/GvpD/RAD55 family RecA-like ATPase